MRFFLITGLCLGIVLLMGAAFLSIDQAVTDDDRATFQAGLDTQAARYDDARGVARRTDFVGKTAHFIVTMREGMFKSSGLNVKTNLPPAPQGWIKADFTVADMEAVTGAPYVKGVAMNGQEALFDRFVDASHGRKLAVAAGYSDGTTRVLVQITASMAKIREAEEGPVRRAQRAGATIARINGIRVERHPQHYRDPFKDRDIRVGYERVTLNLDGLVMVEAVTDGSMADLLSVLQGLDIAGLQAGLPVTVAAYREETGFVSFLTPPAEKAAETDG